MKTKKNKDLNLQAHPYTFVLQEGKAIKHNYLDFSLLLLWGKPEFIDKAPKVYKSYCEYQSKHL